MVEERLDEVTEREDEDSVDGDFSFFLHDEDESNGSEISFWIGRIDFFFIHQLNKNRFVASVTFDLIREN